MGEGEQCLQETSSEWGEQCLVSTRDILSVREQCLVSTEEILSVREQNLLSTGEILSMGGQLLSSAERRVDNYLVEIRRKEKLISSEGGKKLDRRLQSGK